jgi:hypothetical protein
MFLGGDGLNEQGVCGQLGTEKALFVDKDLWVQILSYLYFAGSKIIINLLA